MKLHIKDKNKVIDKEFGKWLLEQVKFELVMKIKVAKLQQWDTYFSESSDVLRLYNKKYYASAILLEAVKHLDFTFTSVSEFEIFIPTTKFVSGFDRLSLDVACRTINYGTQEFHGVPIFTEVFRSVAENIDDYAHEYYPLI